MPFETETGKWNWTVAKTSTLLLKEYSTDSCNIELTMKEMIKIDVSQKSFLFLITYILLLCVNLPPTWPTIMLGISSFKGQGYLAFGIVRFFFYYFNHFLWAFYVFIVWTAEDVTGKGERKCVCVCVWVVGGNMQQRAKCWNWTCIGLTESVQEEPAVQAGYQCTPHCQFLKATKVKCQGSKAIKQNNNFKSTDINLT